MVEVNLNIARITLNVNGSYIPVKRQRYSDGRETKPRVYCL